MSHRRVGVVVLAGLAFVSCQTIIEEMPTATRVTLAPVPVVVLVPLPSAANPGPTAAPQPAPSAPGIGGSGGGGGGSTVPAPLPVPQSLPTAQPLPQGQPTNPPANGGGGGGTDSSECWRGNCNPVASIHAHVYYVVCNGSIVDNRYGTEGPANCDVVLDATPKDARNLATQHRSNPEWDISGNATNTNGFTPKILGQGSGASVTFSVRVDGIQSNVTTYTFR